MTVAETLTERSAPPRPSSFPSSTRRPKAAAGLRDRAIEAVAAKVSSGGKLDDAALEREQRAAHGLAWIATYVEALAQIASYAHACRTRAGSARWRACSRRSAPPNIRAARGRRDDEPGRDGAAARARRRRVRPGGVPHALGARADPQLRRRGARPRRGADQGQPGHRRLTAIPASTRRCRRSATRCAASRKSRSSRMRRSGISRTNICRWS